MRLHPAARWILGVGLLLALVIWVERTVGWAEVVGAWRHIPPVDLLAVVVLTLFGYLARAARLAVHFGGALRSAPARCYRVMALHNLANNFLPLRSGELSFPLLLRQEFLVPTARSVGALLWLRAMDLSAIVVAAGFSLGIDRLGPAAGGAIGLAGLVLPPLGYAALKTRPVEGDGLLARLASGLPLSPASLYAGQALTLVHWGAKLSAWAWLISRLGHIEPVLAWAGAVAGELTSVLPIHGVAGAGTYEAGVVLVLNPLGVPTADALTAATDLHLFLLGFTVLAAGAALLVRR